MSYHHQCECGERINKLTAKSGNSNEEAKDLALYYEKSISNQ